MRRWSRGYSHSRPFLRWRISTGLLSKTLEQRAIGRAVRQNVCQINLNTASDEEILLIPGAGNRMLREFKDTGPTETLAQFRKRSASTSTDKKLRAWNSMSLCRSILTPAGRDILRFPAPASACCASLKNTALTTMEQFRKEIGKYVDKKEVARLQSYVTLN